MKEPVKISSTPEGILVKLKTKIAVAIGLDPYKLKMLIDRYTVTTCNGLNNSKTHFTKINHYNQLNQDKMTIKVFFKFLRILSIKNVKITIDITTPKDRVITVSEEVNLFTVSEDSED